jgi:DNA-directed RNA polymerase
MRSTKNFVEMAVIQATAEALGIQRARKSQKRAEEKGRMSQVGSGAKLVKAMMPLMVEGHVEWKTNAEGVLTEVKGSRINGVRQMMDSRRGGTPCQGTGLLKTHKISAEQAAYICICTVHDSISQQKALLATAIKVGERVETQAHMSFFKKHDSKSFKFAKERTKTTTNYDHKRKAMIGMAGKARKIKEKGVEWTPWTTKQKSRVGLRLIEVMVATTGSIECEEHARGQVYIHATEGFKELLANQSERLERLRPFYSPLPCEPEPWHAEEGGGYPFWLLPLVKTGRGQGDSNVNPAQVLLDSVNEIQKTKWRVNEDVYTTVTEMWRNPLLTIPNVPNRELEPEPERPACLGKNPKDLPRKDMNDGQLKALATYTDARRQWKQKKSVHESKLLACATIRSCAEENLKEAFFCFPHNLDHRGRAYSIPSHYQPQSSDLARGMMEFAEGKPLGTFEGAHWFCVMLATHFGIDDCNMEKRVDWVDANEDLILKTGNDPLSYMEFWCHPDVDAPFQFLAACIEYTEWADDGYGYDYVSHLPCPQDGSCNGIQHFSALLRDPVAAAAVNLTPNDNPLDIYKDCAEILTARLIEEGKGEGLDASLARQWTQFGVTRKCLKRLILTVPYSSTTYGTHRMIEDYLSEVEERTGVDLPFEDVFDAVKFLNERAHTVVGDIVSSAREVMLWLQLCAGVRADHGLPVVWSTPTGMRVSQSYKTTTQGRVKTHLCGETNVNKKTQLSYLEDTDTIHKAKQKNSVSANFVHSLDASHMMLTVVEMAKEMRGRGQTPSFSMIHDSFATHCADADLLARTLRREFVRMYVDHNPLEVFRKANMADMGGVFQLSFLDFSQPVDKDFDKKLKKVLKSKKLRKIQKATPTQYLIDRGKGSELEEFTKAIQPVLEKAGVEMTVTSLPAGSLPPCPEMGDLDIEEVLQSTFFFA